MRQFSRPERVAAYARSQVDPGPSQRFFATRLRVVLETLAALPRGTLLDVGCGPGVLLRLLADTRPGDFTLHGIDLSDAMVREARARLGDVEGARMVVGSAEELPFVDDSFDVLVALGVIEYCDVPAALAEFARITRPAGTVVVSMLNPLSPYRLWEWTVYWPLGRLAGRLEALVGRPVERRHGREHTGIWAVPPRRLRTRLLEAGLQPVRTVFFDVSARVPPFDRGVSRGRRRQGTPPAEAGRAGRWLSTGYLVVSKCPAPG